MTVFASGYYFFAGISPERPMRSEETEKIPEMQHDIRCSRIYADELAAIFLIEELMIGPGSETMAIRELHNLAGGSGLAAYLANLALAERGREADAGSGQTADLFYRRALALHPAKAVRFQLAAWLAGNGREAEAIAEYLLLLPARDAMDALVKLGASAGEVSLALVEGSHWQAAVEYIYQALDDHKLPSAARLELLGRLGQSHAQLGRHKEALPYLEEAFRAGCTETAWWYARSLEATGNKAAAGAIYEDLGTAGAYRLGLLLKEQGKMEEAARVLGSSESAAARWQAARLWEELGQPERAIAIYLGMAREESRYRDDAAFRAYIIMQRNGQAGAQEMLELLMAYPAWAARLTGEASWESVATPEYEKPSFIRVAEALQQRGRQEWADIALAIGQGRAGLTDMLALGDWHLARGNYFQATRWGIRSLNTEKTERGYLLAYPRPFKELVLEAAAKYELDPHLIWAVMREESHFRPQARSWAGAMGLMQIMPATGMEIAGRKGVELVLDDLLKPEVNIDFGAFYLRRLLNKFEGDLDKVLAAYNGGSGNVRRWSESPLGATPKDFPTAITFFETREYLTKVLDSYLTYNWLYGCFSH